MSAFHFPPPLTPWLGKSKSSTTIIIAVSNTSGWDQVSLDGLEWFADLFYIIVFAGEVQIAFGV